MSPYWLDKWIIKWAGGDWKALPYMPSNKFRKNYVVKRSPFGNYQKKMGDGNSCALLVGIYLCQPFHKAM